MQKQRQEQILHILQFEKYVTVKYLTHILNCSTATINRDLNEMQRMNLIKRSYGGAEAEAFRPFLHGNSICKKRSASMPKRPLN